MAIELTEEVQHALEEAASRAGMSASGYASLLIQEQLHRASEKKQNRAEAIDAVIDRLRSANSSSGRGGRRWRDFIHEGHGK